MGSSTAQYGIHGRWVRSRQITSADTATTVAVIDIPAGTFIPPHSTFIYVSTAFAGGTPSIDVGDTDVDAYIDTTAITETAVGAYADVDAALAVTGKYYAAADTINAVMSTALTAGAAYVFAYLIDVSDIIDD